jgi:hypothetical protein
MIQVDNEFGVEQIVCFIYLSQYGKYSIMEGKILGMDIKCYFNGETAENKKIIYDIVRDNYNYRIEERHVFNNIKTLQEYLLED